MYRMIQRRLQNSSTYRTLYGLCLQNSTYLVQYTKDWFTNRNHQSIISLICTISILLFTQQFLLTRIFLNNGRLLHHLTNLNRRLSAILVRVCTIFSSGEIVSSIVSSMSFSWGRVELENQRCSTSMISLKLHRKKHSKTLAKLENDT